MGSTLGAWYHATKFAVEGFSDCLRVELKPFGIDVIVIEPEGIRTECGQIALDTLHQASGQGRCAVSRSIRQDADSSPADEWQASCFAV